MAEENPSIVVEPVIIPRPVTGHRRMVQVSHPACGNGNLLTTDASWSDGLQPNFVNYAFTPLRGPKQRAVHSSGPSEITWNLSGELTNNTMGLLGLMNSNARGVNFNGIIISQGPNDTYMFNNPSPDGSSPGFFLPWSNFSLSGSQNGAVTFTLEGKSTQLPAFSASPLTLPFPDVPVPAWFTGNDFVTAWTLSHSVNLTPNWRNSVWALPAYYRSGHSEYTIQVTMMAALREHYLIKFGFGKIAIIEAVVTSRNVTFGGRGSPVTYQVSVTNAAVNPDQFGNQNVFGPSIDIEIFGGPPSAAVV